MDPQSLYRLSYGMYIVSSKSEDKFNGQIANTVFQISNSPVTVAVSINKENLTHEYIMGSKEFTVSVISEDMPLSTIGHFGFKSGRDVEKFVGIDYGLTERNLPYVLDYCLAYLEVKVVQDVDAGTHTIFIGEVTGGQVVGEGMPMTYAFYHQIKRGSVPKSAPTYVERRRGMDKYVCDVCGYLYDPEVGDPDGDIAPGTAFEDLPAGWVCPVCGAGKEDFSKE